MDGWPHGCMNAHMDGRMDEWVEGLLDIYCMNGCGAGWGKWKQHEKGWTCQCMIITSGSEQ